MNDTAAMFEFLDRLAGRSPTPGGGGAAALTGAVACAQGRMVVAYSIGKKTGQDARRSLEALAEGLLRCDQMLRALIGEDSVAYEALVAARRGGDGEPDHADESQAAVRAAIAVPMEIAAVSAAALSLLDRLKETANRHLLSDLGVAAAIGETAARAAHYTVQANLTAIRNEPERGRLADQVRELVEHAATHRASIEAYLRDAL